MPTEPGKPARYGTGHLLMPQPFATKLKGNPNAIFYESLGMQKRPQLAIAFAEAMEQFAVCEGSLGTLFLTLNSKKPDEAFIKLSENVTFSQRVAMVRKCANGLDPSDKALVWAVTDRAETAAGMRNKIAHCSWGYCDALPQAVLSLPTSRTNLDIRERLKQKIGLPSQREASEVGIMVYEERDFTAVRMAGAYAMAPLDLLGDYLMNDSTARKILKSQILSDPQTSQRYDKRVLNEYL